MLLDVIPWQLVAIAEPDNQACRSVCKTCQCGRTGSLPRSCEESAPGGGAAAPLHNLLMVASLALHQILPEQHMQVVVVGSPSQRFTCWQLALLQNVKARKFGEALFTAAACRGDGCLPFGAGCWRLGPIYPAGGQA